MPEAWIRRRRNLERMVELSKCGDIRDGIVKINRKEINEQMETRLRALQTDYIDLYLLHRDNPVTQVSRYIDTLNKAKRVGKPACSACPTELRNGSGKRTGMQKRIIWKASMFPVRTTAWSDRWRTCRVGLCDAFRAGT